jgi:hypothetical protein
MSSKLSPSPSFESPSNSPLPSLSLPRTSFARAGRAAAQTGLRALAVLAALVAFVAPAQATPVDVFFNGPSPASDPTTSFGISLASATNASVNHQVPILDQIELLTGIAGKVSVIIPPSSSLIVSPNPPTSSLNRVSSPWQIENISGQAMTGANYLLFTHTTAYSVGSKSIDYVDSNVGLQIDKDLGWAIIKTQFEGVDYYYPALLLDGDLAAGARASASINYVVAQALIKADGDYRIPQLQLGYATVVPEPGTALLLGLGLTCLAARRRRA